ncbi:MAG: tRNA (adenosine(37)-N6)-dimethylallyltransferase MiaA [Verrucomicrobiota bacterium]
MTTAPDISPFYLAGPTGCGKTGVALELAGLWNAEIVNADAYQIYRGFDILSAKPSAEEQAKVPHHLFGAVPLQEDFDVARYEEVAKACLEQIQSRGRRPIVVGGSGLYLKSLTHGLTPLPPGDDDLRAELEQRSLEDLAAELAERDPEGAAIVNLKNRRYVTRALEITILAGRPMSEIKTEWEGKSPEFAGVVLVREREALYERINLRTEAMLAAGAVEEVRNLPESISHTAGKAIGVQEIQQFLAGKIDHALCLELIQKNTRRYAKRQMNWFRRETGFRPVELGGDEPPQKTAVRIAAMFA